MITSRHVEMFAIVFAAGKHAVYTDDINKIFYFSSFLPVRNFSVHDLTHSAQCCAFMLSVKMY